MNHTEEQNKTKVDPDPDFLFNESNTSEFSAKSSSHYGLQLASVQVAAGMKADRSTSSNPKLELRLGMNSSQLLMCFPS